MDKLLGIFSKILKVDKDGLDLTAPKSSFEKWDSLAHVRLVSEIEEEFDVEIPISDIPKINKLEDFLKYVE